MKGNVVFSTKDVMLLYRSDQCNQGFSSVNVLHTSMDRYFISSHYRNRLTMSIEQQKKKGKQSKDQNQ